MAANDIAQDPAFLGYRTTIKSKSMVSPRYKWLHGYLHQTPEFVERTYPVSPGRTRTIVADFFSDSTKSPIILCLTNLVEIHRAISTRSPEVAVRLILVVAISGVSDDVREDQLSRDSCVSLSRQDVALDFLAPCVTTAHIAGNPTPNTHPISEHRYCLPDPTILCCVAATTRVDPEILLRHLDQEEHLIYRPLSWMKRKIKANQGEKVWLDISLGVDQHNYVTAAMLKEPLVRQRAGTETRQHQHTLLLLGNEDNCLGIDFNTHASSLDQPCRSYDGTPHELFQAMLRSKSETERSEILKEPRILICNYIAGLSESFSCHVELYRRKWNYLYEPHANTSAVYGEAKDRARVRKEAKQLFTHIQYLDQSLLMLKQITGETEMKSGIMETVKDFNQLSRQLKSMKLSYDTFIEQQVSKISLQESRQSMTEARDLQRLSYLGFVFAPLSLASSFFSINIQPLGGLASVWSFVVTSLSILSLSILVLLSLNGRLYDMVREAIRSLRLSMPSRPARDQQLTLPQTETSPGSQRQHTDAGHAHLEQRGDTTGRATPPQPGTRVNPPPIQEPRRTIDQMPENRWRNRERSPGARSQRRREPSVSASYYPPDTSVRRGSRPPNTRQLRKEPDNTPSYRPPVINE